MAKPTAVIVFFYGDVKDIPALIGKCYSFFISQTCKDGMVLVMVMKNKCSFGLVQVIMYFTMLGCALFDSTYEA